MADPAMTRPTRAIPGICPECLRPLGKPIRSVHERMYLACCALFGLAAVTLVACTLLQAPWRSLAACVMTLVIAGVGGGWADQRQKDHQARADAQARRAFERDQDERDRPRDDGFSGEDDDPEDNGTGPDF